jgi:predicted glycogen debranching enzyme
MNSPFLFDKLSASPNHLSLGEGTVINFGRDICGNYESSSAREWLVTNGIGGYASGTVAGALTRRYHGLLVAALKPPLDRKLLVTGLDETAHYDGESFELFTNRWVSTVDPHGYRLIENFYLDGTMPVWNFAFADALLEKRIWMQQGANTTFVRFTLTRSLHPVQLTLKSLVNYRDYHGETQFSEPMKVESTEHGIKIVAHDGATPFYLLSDRAEAQPRDEWYLDYSLSVEQYRGFRGIEDHFFAAEFNVTLQPGESVTIIASTDANPNLDSDSALAERRKYEAAILSQAGSSFEDAPPAIRHLLLAADQFIVKREVEGEKDGRSIIAGYHWFGDWGRDTMISLPGLTITTGRPKIARSILRTFARYVDKGMLPNRFPDAGEMPEYNTVDATLWYFEAIRAYHAATNDEALLKELFPVLKDIIDWHMRGTRYQIHVDPNDGMFYAGEPGVQLTWMDAKVGDWVVTPRIGKPIEINALWYHALSLMAAFAKQIDEPSTVYQEAAQKVHESFNHFWNEEAGYCFDVLDGQYGNEAYLRPNQLFAVSLPAGNQDEPALFDAEEQKAIVDACARHLLTSHGLRSLARFNRPYVGHYGGDAHQRDGAYHQGTVWGWLVGPFVSAHLKVYQDVNAAQQFLNPILDHLSAHGLGSISEIFDGDAPFTPRGCIAQAWSVAEVLRVWKEIREM